MPPAYEILLLNTAIPQIQAAQSGDTYVVPRDIAFSTVANLANGTYLLPSLTFSSDTDTGIFRQGANQLGFTAGGGSDQMVLTTTGLGIGTSSPLLTASGRGNVTINGSTSSILAFGIGGANSSYVFSASDRLEIDAASTRWIQFNTNGNERMRLDSSGNLGIGVTPSAWGFGGNLELPATNNISFKGVYGNILSNAYYDLSQNRFEYTINGFAAQYQIGSGGQHKWFTAPSGTAGNAISFTQALTLDANRNLLLNGTSAGAASVGTFTMFNGTAPTGSVTDGIILFAADVSSSSELRVRDEAGNVTTLSPHNFSLIPEGPSEELAWAYYSEKNGKRINVDMLKLARMVEKLTGEKLVFEG